jgi:hypothetical protein
MDSGQTCAPIIIPGQQKRMPDDYSNFRFVISFNICVRMNKNVCSVSTYM